MRLHPLLAAAVAPALLVGGVAAAGPAAASTATARHASVSRSATQRVAAQRLQSRHARIDLTGVIVSHSRRTVRIAVSAGRVGTTRVRPQVLSISIAGRTKGSSRSFHHALVNGDQLHIAGVGSVSRSDVRLTAERTEQVSTTTAQAWFGLVQAYDPGTHLAGVYLLHGGLGHDGGPDGHGNLGQHVTVDLSIAAVTADGVAGGTVAPGDLVLVVGEASGLTVVASTVYAYSSVPDVVAGEINDITGTVVTVDGRELGGQQQIDLGSGPSAIPVILNGTPGMTVADLSVGDHVLVLGSAGTGGAFVPQVAVAFNDDDHGPCGDNGNEHRGRGHHPVPTDVSASLSDAAAYLVGGIGDGNVTGTGDQATLPADGSVPAPATSSLVTEVVWDVSGDSPATADFCIAASSDGATTFHYDGHLDGDGAVGEIHGGGCS